MVPLKAEYFELTGNTNTFAWFSMSYILILSIFDGTFKATNGRKLVNSLQGITIGPLN